MSNTQLQATRLHLVGCGKMGSAVLQSWLDAGIPAANISARVASESSATSLHKKFGIHAATDCRYDGEDVVLLAVKPQMLDAVLAADWQPAPSSPLYISVAAGKSLGYFAGWLGEDARVIRSMPNTPSLVGQGVTTLVAAGTASETDKSLTTALFAASGTAIWLDSEEALNAAAAIAGSGPAYVFHFAECLLQAALAHGLPEDTARALVRGTLAGSIALADAEGWEDLAQLRQNVTSKGGVTQAALDVLMPKLPELVEQAVAANIARSKALA